MKITFITAHLGGGAGKAISGLALQGKRDFDVQVILLEQPQEMKYISLLNAGGVICIVATAMRDAIDAVIYSDVTILCWWNHPLTIRFLLQADNIPCHMVLWSHINGCFYPLLPAGFLQLFDGILFTSPASLESSHWRDTERLQIENKSDIVYGMGNYDPASSACKTDYSFKADHPIIGYIGTIGFEKIHSHFIDYCIAVAGAVPSVEFRMIGRPSSGFLEAVKLNGEIERHFSFSGYLEDPSDSYLSFDIFGYLLHPRSYATTENVLLEAMSCGLPIIVLNNLVERHIVHDGINGFLVNNKEEYAAKILELCRSEELRERIGAQARKYVIKKYDANENYKRFRKTITKTAAHPRAAIDVKNLFRNGFEAFCYFAGINPLAAEGELQTGDAFNKKGWKVLIGEHKAGIAQYYCYFSEEKKLERLLKMMTQAKQSDGL